jgi:hypothetical protein
MFQHEIRANGFSAGLFVVQLVLAPLGGLIFGLILWIVLEELLRTRDGNILGYFGYSVQGFLLGYKMQTSFPRSIQSWGPWIWIPPVGLLLCCFGSELARHSKSAIVDCFWPGLGNPGGVYLIVLVTLPAIASCFYSAGIVAASRPRRTALGKLFHAIITGGRASSQSILNDHS